MNQEIISIKRKLTENKFFYCSQERMKKRFKIIEKSASKLNSTKLRQAILLLDEIQFQKLLIENVNLS